MDPKAASWKSENGVDFLPELREIQMRIQGVNVYLVGMPGSGKTTLGRMLAEGLNYRWMDLDQFIEQKLGKSATKVFEEDGEETWRKQETLGMGALQTYVQTVVSTGGGIMQRKENFPFLHSGLIVWLDLPPDAIIARLQASGEIAKRPLLKQAPDPVAVLRELYDARKANYALADVRVVLRAEDDGIKCLKRVTHRIIEELDLRPPKAKMWEEKRNKMKNLWETMKAKGTATDINEVPAEEGGENPAIGAIAALNAEDGDKKKDKGGKPKKKGFGTAVRKNGGGGGKAASREGGPVVPSAATAAVGSQGVGFGLGLEEYMKGGEEGEKEGGDEEQQVADAA
ncbi:shikimate kinase [Nannochloropsis oceanica]